MADKQFPVLVSKDRSANAEGNPIYVQLSDGATALGVVVDALKVNITNDAVPIASPIDVKNLSQLVNIDHDEKVFIWTAGDLTQVVYKKASVTVATVTLTWTAGDLTGMVVS